MSRGLFCYYGLMKILVIGGGNYGEREVSLKSAAEVQRALRELGHEVSFADPAEGENKLRQAIAESELVFPILHGEGGEDGSIQEVIDSVGRPYLGSGVEESRLSFDKAAFKERLAEAGILTPKSAVVDVEGFERSELRRRPFVLKPFDSGSSIDTFIIRDVDSDLSKLREVLKKRGRMLLEELIEGVEITVGVLGETALPVVEIVPPSGQEFDYENKYNGATQELVPPEHVDDATVERAQRLGEKVHQLAGARHLSRTDMMVDTDGKIYVLEINTLPGFTPQSLYPKAAAAAGLDWNQLNERLVEMVKAG